MNTSKKVRPPLSYYGGKQKMLSTILPLIPEHRTYCEPFVGGAAVLFAMPPAKISVINDTNGEVINFYRQVKLNFSKLQKEIRATLHSRHTHHKARFIYYHPELFTPLERAAATYIQSHQSYASILGSTWACSVKDNTCERKFQAKKEQFTNVFAKRLESVQIECRDALEVIRLRDAEDTFFYVDPPYHNSNMGTYGGYTEQDFEALLQLLSTIKGKFLLSSYPSEMLKNYTRKNKWASKCIEMALNVPSAKKNGRRKVEVLTGNYAME